MNDVMSARPKQLGSYLLLGGLLVALAASFYSAWDWTSASWFRIRPLAGGANPAYSPGPLIPVMVLLMLSAHLRRLRPTPEIASQDQFHAAFVKVLLPAMTAFVKVWNRYVYGVSKSAEALRDQAYKHRAVGVWVAWGILAGLVALTLHYARLRGYGIWQTLARPVAFPLLFAHIVVFGAAVFYIGWRTYHADEKARASAATKGNQVAGLALLAFFLLFHFAAVRGDTLRLSIMSFLGCLIALLWYFYGWRVARVFIFPLAFMVFTLPMEWVEDKFGLPAQILATKNSLAIMQFIGVKAEMTGLTAFKVLRASGPPVDFSVAAPCSGLKSLVALTAISATYAYVTQKSFGKMLVIMVCGPFIAIITNIIRLVTVGVVAQFWGRRLALVVHDHALPIYILAILLLIVIDKLINSRWLRIEDF